MAASASVEYRCSDFCWCYLQQTVHFFQSNQHAVILNKLAFTSLHCSIFNYTLKELWSHKPSHKHDSNKYQSKAFVICDHKSDETRSVTHVNKVCLVWLMFRVLSNSTAPIRNSFPKSWGLRASVYFFSLPLPCHSFSFFLLSSQLYWRTRAETLVTQAKRFLLWSQRLCFRGLYWLFVYFSL